VPCFAESLGDCAGGMSREHYLSEALIRVFSDAPHVRGIAWLPEGEVRSVGIGSLQSRILCQAHNNHLSPLDEALAEMQEFAEAVHEWFGEEREAGTGIEGTMDGPLLERALLKLALGFTYSRSFRSTQERPPPSDVIADRKGHLLRALFGIEPIDDVGGLYAIPELLRLPMMPNFSTQCAVNDANEVIGARILFRRLYFAIALNRLVPVAGAIHRPAELVWCNEQRTNIARLELTW